MLRCSKIKYAEMFYETAAEQAKNLRKLQKRFQRRIRQYIARLKQIISTINSLPWLI